MNLCETPAALPYPLYVIWVDGLERLRIFDYAPATHEFTETLPGIATGRAAIVNDTDLEVSLQSTVAMTADSMQSLHVEELKEGGTRENASPRLEFYRGPTRLASLTQTGILRVSEAVETAALPGSDRFEFYGGGALAAVLGPVNLTAVEIVED